MIPTLDNWLTAMEATWPAASEVLSAGCVIRDGQGGGKRVSAARVAAGASELDLDAAEAQMRALGQTPLFMLRADEQALDHMLSKRGYRMVDPVTLYGAPVDQFSGKVPPVSVFPNWEPLAIMADIWDEDGIGPARRQVMNRVQGPRTCLLGRYDDTPAGAAFLALDGTITMMHALYVRPEFRRCGLAVAMMQQAARWSKDVGADWIGLPVTKDNIAANALYQSLGMQIVGEYFYRKLDERRDVA